MKALVTPVSYVQVGARTWRVYILERFSGHAIRGEVSAYFRARNGKGQLFPSMRSLEQSILKAATGILHKRAEKIREREELLNQIYEVA